MTKASCGWSYPQLGEIASTALGKMLDRGRTRGLPQVPYLRNVNVQWGHIDVSDILTMEIADDERDRFGLCQGDLLVCEGGEIGRAAIWNGSKEYMAYQKALHRVRPSTAVEARYLLHLFAHYASNGNLAANATGSTILHLPQQRLRRLRVPLPPLEEQRRIVDILEDHFSRLDAARQLLQSTVGRVVAYRRSQLDMLTESGSTKHILLSDLVARIEAGKSFGSSGRPAGPDEWGIVKVSAMTWGEFRPRENKVVSATGRIDPRYEIRPGDVLVSRANTSDYVGAAVRVRDTRPRLLLSDKSLRLIPRPGCLPEYIVRVLSAPRARQQMSERATGNQDSMRNISQSTLLGIEVPWVDPEGQVALVAAASDVDVFADRARRNAEDALARTETLRRALLQSAFSGRLTRSFASSTAYLEEAAGA